MRKEYDIKSLNPRQNPYTKTSKKSVTINLDESIVSYFKEEANTVGVPYQALINMYLRDCMINNRHLAWEKE